MPSDNSVDVTPKGVKLRDWEDSPSLRQDIFESTKSALLKQFPQSYGGVRLELHDVDYDNPKEFTVGEQKDALMTNKFLAHRLRGTFRLFDEKTGELLDEQPSTLMRVPYLSDRHTFITGGNEYCLQARTRILTDRGYLPIAKIVKDRMTLRVLSYDFTCRQFVWKPIIGWFSRPAPSRIGRAKFFGGGFIPEFPLRQRFSSLWATPDHRVISADGTKHEIQAAHSLLLLDHSLSSNQRQVVIGSLLGDGHINDDGQLVIRHAADQKAYVEFKAAIFGDLIAPAGIISCTYDRQKYPTWQTQYGFSLRVLGITRELRALSYPEGRRVLADWYREANELALAIWYADDGSAVSGPRSNNRNYHDVRLHTNNFTPDEVEELIAWLKTRWGLKARKVKENAATRPNYGISFSGPSARAFLCLVAPFLPAAMHYKLGKRPLSGNCGSCGKEIARQSKKCSMCGGKLTCLSAPSTWWDIMLQTAGTRVPEVLADNKGELCLRPVAANFLQNTGAQLESSATVYDIEVQDTHNFFANGVLVSNCTVNQARLMPGVYTRRRESGELEAHFNARRGTGPSFRLELEPQTGLFRMNIGQAKLRLYSLLHDIGVDDKELEAAWGPELLASNKASYDRRVFDNAYARLVRKPDPNATREQKVVAIRDALQMTRLSREVVRRNLPGALEKRASAVQPEVSNVGADVAQPAQPEGPMDPMAAMRPIGEETGAKLSKEDLIGIAMLLNESHDAGIPLNETVGQLTADIKAVVDENLPGLHPELVNAFSQPLVKAALTPSELDMKAHRAATSPRNARPLPSPAQKAVGNYKKGKVFWKGLPISIENPMGSFRSGVSAEGKAWRTEIRRGHYGYIRRTEGADGDHIDCFICPRPLSDLVYVVNQLNPKTRKFDEVKCMLGYPDMAKAKAAYLANYEKGWKGLGTIVPSTLQQFKDWLKNGDTSKPYRQARL